MKMLSKKTIAALVAGTFIMAGAVTPFIASAANTAADNRPAYHHQQLTPEQAAERIANTFGVSKTDVLKYNKDGKSFKDISRAAFLANASGKSLDEVFSHKTATNTWKDVAGNLGITKEQFKAARQNLMIHRLNTKFGVDKETAADLMAKGYKARGIAMASLLAKQSGKSIQDVAALKNQDNTWHAVAASLGIDDNTFKQDQKQVKHFGHKHHKNHKQTPERK